MSSHFNYYPEQQAPFGDYCQPSSGPHQAGGAQSGLYQQPPAYGADPGSTSKNRDRKAPHEFWDLGTQIPDPNLPRVGINTQKYPEYDPKVDWERLEAMIEVRPINYTSYDVADPVRVGGLLLTLSTFQRDALNDYAVVASGKDLYHWMEKYPAARGFRASKAVEALRGFAIGPLAYDMWIAESATKGGPGGLIGHDTMALVEVICDADQNDLWLLRGEYQRTYNIELADAIKKKFSGRKLERLLLSALELARPSDSQTVQADEVARDVEALWEATRGKPHDETITHVFTKRSRSHLAAVIMQYKAQWGTSLRNDIKKILKGSDYGNAILYILDGAKYKRDGQGAWRDAKLLMLTMKGVGTKTSELHYRLVRAQWNKQRFVAVKQAFKERYGMTLEDRIAEDTSSYYKNVLFIICQQTLDIERGEGILA